MSTMVYGPPFVIDGPVPEPPPFRLLDVAQHPDISDVHWQNGVQVYPFSCELADAVTPCLEGTYKVKNEGEGWELPIFGPFTVYLPETCSSLSIGDQEAFRRRAEIVLGAVESFSVERQLAVGSFVQTNPYLGDANIHVLVGTAAAPTAQNPKEALALLEDAVGSTGKAGFIHASPSIVSQWDANGYTLVEEGGILRTKRGTTVVVGDGYIGTKPDASPALGAHEAWAYATGPVQTLSDEVFMLPDNVKEALDRESNVVTYRAERTHIVAWDTCLQAGVLVNRAA